MVQTILPPRVSALHHRITANPILSRITPTTRPRAYRSQYIVIHYKNPSGRQEVVAQTAAGFLQVAASAMLGCEWSLG